MNHNAFGAWLRPILGFAWVWATLTSSGTAQAASVHSYCTVQNNVEVCYPSRQEAEEVIRQGSYINSQKVLGFTTVSESNFNNLSMVYRAKDSVPETMFDFAYRTGGADSCPPTGCSSEGQAVDGLTNYHAGRTPSGCTFEFQGLSGDYAEPFNTIISNAGSGSRSGTIYYNSASTPRSYHARYRCPGLPDSVLDTSLSKWRNFTCPISYYAYSSNPGGLTFEQGAEAIASGVLCYATGDTSAIITTYLAQVASCPANNHPCYPATGDKSRAEPDFEFGGRTFTRYYHSLAQTSMNPAFAPGWTHSFSDRVQFLGLVGATRIDEQGYVETFKRTSTQGIYEYASDQTKNNLLVLTPGQGYTLYEGAGAIKLFDMDGKLISYEDAGAGIDLVFEYDGGRLKRAIDRLGRTLDFVYFGGVLNKIILPDGQFVTYGRDTHGNITSASYPDGSVRTYVYNEASLSSPGHANELTGIVDENGDRYANFGYDARGRVTLSQLVGGEQTSLTYVSDSQINVVTPTGEAVSYQIAPGQSYRRLASVAGTASTTTMTYSSGQLSQSSRAGVNTLYGYTPKYRNIVIEAYGTPEERKTVLARDANYALTSRETFAKVSGAEVSKRLEVWTRNARGQALTASIVDSATGASRTQSMTYCEQTDIDAGACPVLGLLTSVDGFRTDVSDITTYTYYPSDGPSCPGTGCEYRKGDLWKVTNPLAQATEYLAYDGMGRALSIKNANGVIIDLEFDPRGRVLARKVRGLDGGSETDDAITRFEYWATGQVKKVTEPDGAFISYTYDDAHRLTDVTDSLGNTIHYTLDSAGNRTREDTKDPSGTLKRTLSRVYNALGQLQSAKDANLNTTAFTYDARGNLDTTTDPLNRVADNNYDPLDRVIQVVANNGGSGNQRAVSGFGYDVFDNLVRVTDPKGLNTTYAYNALGNLTQLISPDTGTTTYGYDSAGNRTSQLDARGINSVYTYDALGRLLTQQLPTTAQNVSFEYDTVPADCAVGEAFGVGRLARITDDSGSTRYCYDRRGNVVRKVQTVTGGSTGTVGATYDAADRVTAITYPSGAIVTYLRNGNGQINRVDAVPSTGASQVTLVSSASYLPFGPLGTLTFGNGRVLTKAYDQNYGIDKVSDSGTNGLSEDFTLNAVGNVTTLAERTAGSTITTRTFTYDGLDRLTALKNGSTNVQSFTYDATGNRLTKKVGSTTTTNTYASTNHRLTKIGSTNLTYDGAGNTTKNGTPAFTYDDRNRLREYKSNGSAVTRTYRYNGKGERVSKTISAGNSGNRYYIYDEAGRLLGEYLADGTRVQEYVWLDDILVAVLSSHDGTTYQFVETDHLGTPRAVIKPSTNTIIWRWNLTNTAFGDHADTPDADGNSVSYTFNFRYPGQWNDSESGLFYNYYRDYDPKTGRYIESDPIGLSGGIGTYVYALQAPLSAIDPSGHKAKLIDLPPTNQRGDASIYCIDGVIRPMYFWSNWPNDYRNCQAIVDCVYAHEMSHVKDANRSSPGLCKKSALHWILGTPPRQVTFSDEADPKTGLSELDNSELRAHAVELRCLTAKLKGQQCDNRCKSIVSRRINQIIHVSIPAIYGDQYGIH